ncbi:MAG: helix-turn-helix transcriptional regulator, partial [Asticcacaulis sp.]
MEKDTAKPGNGIIPLTDRERQCLALVYNHMNSKQIAAQLGISPSTVETHIKKVRERMGGIDRWTAARKVFEMEGATPRAVAHQLARPPPAPIPSRMHGDPHQWGS